jgi:hypothetical protein
MIVDQKLAKKTIFLTVYYNNLDIKTENRITPLKVISPEVLKFRYLANSATQESDDSHADFICISQIFKRFNFLHESREHQFSAKSN